MCYQHRPSALPGWWLGRGQFALCGRSGDIAYSDFAYRQGRVHHSADDTALYATILSPTRVAFRGVYRDPKYMVDASFIHRWFDEVWNGKSESAVDEMFAEDGIAHGLTDPEGNEVRGPEGFKRLHRQFVEAYPDLRIIVEDTVVEGDKIAARCRVTGSHLGHSLGVAPTNGPVEFTGMTIVRVRDGKITEAWNEFNFMEMYRQLGALKLELE